MRRKNLILGSVCFALLISALFCLPAPVPAEEITGFRGMNWGDPLPKEGMKFVEKKPAYGGVDFYSREGDNLTIGASIIKYIRYGYWNGRLSYVYITCDGITNHASLLAAFTEKFGEPRQPNKYIESYHWYLDATRILFIYNSIGESTIAYLSSRVIANEQKEWATGQAKKGKNDF